MMSTLATIDPQANLIGADVRKDLTGVNCAVVAARNLAPQQVPTKARKGQSMDVVDKDIVVGDPLPERPAENTLEKITMEALLPPPTTQPIALDGGNDPKEQSYVKEQSIEFLLLQKADTPNATWNFPTNEVMQKVFDHVRHVCDHNLILEVCQWFRVEKHTGIATIMLNTVNLPLFKEVRLQIRLYTGHAGFRLEIYSKSLFVQRYGITMYVQRENANLPAHRLLRSLFWKTPELKVDVVRFICKSVFTSNPPDHPIGRRSRMGDAIYLFASPAMEEKLKTFPDDHRFAMSL